MEDEHPGEPPSTGNRSAEALDESHRLVQGSERVYAALMPLLAVEHGIDRVIELVPELEPEMRAAKARITELGEHLKAAQDVLGVRLKMLVEEAQALYDERQSKAA